MGKGHVAGAGVAFCIGLFFSSFPMEAQTWTNLGSGEWGANTNWMPKHPPASLGDSAIIQNVGFINIDVEGFYAPSSIYYDSTFAGISGSGGLSTGLLQWNSGGFAGPMTITVSSTFELTGAAGQDAKGLSARAHQPGVSHLVGRKFVDNQRRWIYLEPFGRHLYRHWRREHRQRRPGIE